MYFTEKPVRLYDIHELKQRWGIPNMSIKTNKSNETAKNITIKNTT